MKLRYFPLLLLCLGLTTTAFSESDRKMKMAISTTDDAGEADVQLEFDFDDLGFDLHDMQEGENRSFIDKSGRSVLVTREADGIRFDVDGESISVPLFSGMHDGAVWIDGGNHDDMNVHVMHGRPMPGHRAVAMAGAPKGVVILSGETIDDATQQAIRSLLESAGYDDDVKFIDKEHGPGGIDGPHGVRVIRKTVEVTD